MLLAAVRVLDETVLTTGAEVKFPEEVSVAVPVVTPVEDATIEEEADNELNAVLAEALPETDVADPTAVSDAEPEEVTTAMEDKLLDAPSRLAPVTVTSVLAASADVEISAAEPEVVVLTVAEDRFPDAVLVPDPVVLSTARAGNDPAALMTEEDSTVALAADAKLLDEVSAEDV